MGDKAHLAPQILIHRAPEADDVAGLNLNDGLHIPL